jgi:peptide/nickel transport system ATP-binding protein
MTGAPAAPLLQLRGVSARYTPSQLAVREVTLGIDGGESVGLVGESGSGKTTLGNCAAGLMPLAAGEIRYQGALVSRPGGRLAFPRVRGVQIVYQDPYSALNPHRSIGSLISEVLRVHRLVPRSAVAGRCADLLARVGLDASLKPLRPRDLSGGMRQRVAIARALAFEPRILVADEIVSALDASVQAQVLNLLAGLRERTGIAILLITHDLAVVNQSCDRVAVMHDGEIVETGPTTDVLARPRHAHTGSLIKAVPRLESA